MKTESSQFGKDQFKIQDLPTIPKYKYPTLPFVSVLQNRTSKDKVWWYHVNPRVSWECMANKQSSCPVQLTQQFFLS